MTYKKNMIVCQGKNNVEIFLLKDNQSLILSDIFELNNQNSLFLNEILKNYDSNVD